MRSCKEAATTWLDTSCASGGLSLLPHEHGSRKQYHTLPYYNASSTHQATDLGAIHQIGAPIHVYPLYENAFRAHHGQSLKANHQESAKLYADFSKVAAKNEYAWNQGKSSAEDVIGKIGPKNRMICYPCKHSSTSHRIQLTELRSASHERLQHRQSRLSYHPDIHHCRQSPQHSVFKMDLPARRCRNTRFVRILAATKLPHIA